VTPDRREVGTHGASRTRTDRVADLRCSITRWVDDEPQPGLVEACFVDADGHERRLIDKVPMFTSSTLTAASKYPVPGLIRCEVITIIGDSVHL
jgi:hypothetical protein